MEERLTYKDRERIIQKKLDIFQDTENYDISLRLEALEEAIQEARKCIKENNIEFKHEFMNVRIKFTNSVIDELEIILNEAKQLNN